MQLHQENKRQNETHFLLSGTWDFSDYKIFASILHHIKDDQVKAVIIDLQQLDEISTPGLGCLLYAKEEAEKNQTQITLVSSSSEQVSKMLDMCQFNKIFLIN